MSDEFEQTNGLLERAAAGDQTAEQELLDHHRQRLRRMVTLRMDPRLKTRFDPSDVVQEALITASTRLPAYLQQPSIPFYAWLRKITFEELLKLHDHHLRAQKRSVMREQGAHLDLSDESTNELVARLATTTPGPRTTSLRQEIHRRTREALQQLPPRDRELLELRYLEQLSNNEIAAIFEISETAVRARHFRAIRRLRAAIDDSAA